MIAKNSPILIVMTPVRNEAWVLPAYLKVTSLWADHIIVADQMSTDGSRDILQSCDKVIMIDNTNPEFNEDERWAMLVSKAREVTAGRDAILFGLDADEVFAANFLQTDDWKKILKSKPGDVFWFKWAEIDNSKKYFKESVCYPWMFHDDGKEPFGNYVRKMHSMRIPYPIDEKQMYYVNDFYVLHLARLNKYRTFAKRRFYMFVDWEVNRRDAVTLFRMYAQVQKEKKDDFPYSLTEKMTRFKDFDVLTCVDCEIEVNWMNDYVAERLPKLLQSSKRKRLANLDIWQKDFCERYKIQSPQRFKNKMLFYYLKKTQKIKENYFIKVVDKILKLIG